MLIECARATSSNRRSAKGQCKMKITHRHTSPRNNESHTVSKMSMENHPKLRTMNNEKNYDEHQQHNGADCARTHISRCTSWSSSPSWINFTSIISACERTAELCVRASSVLCMVNGSLAAPVSVCSDQSDHFHSWTSHDTCHDLRCDWWISLHRNGWAPSDRINGHKSAPDIRFDISFYFHGWGKWLSVFFVDVLPITFIAADVVGDDFQLVPFVLCSPLPSYTIERVRTNHFLSLFSVKV